MACLQHPKAGERWLLVRWVSTTRTHPRLQTSAVAWGECGLDYAKNNSPPDVQRRVFAQQIVKAVEVGKPLVVHSRKAEDDTIAILRENMPKEWHVHVRLSVTLRCALPRQLTLIVPCLFPIDSLLHRHAKAGQKVRLCPPGPSFS